MRLEGAILREPGERPLPSRLVHRAVRRRGRPPVECLPFVSSAEDAALLQRHGVPVQVLTSDWVTANGYPVEFRPWLLVPERIEKKFRSTLRMLPIRDEAALRQPGLAEMITFLLRFDAIAARLVAVRNRAALDPNELYRRVRNEGVEAAATRVRLQEFSPAIPRVGNSISRRELLWIEKNNPPLERFR
jgi:hypothetical protein